MKVKNYLVLCVFSLTMAMAAHVSANEQVIRDALAKTMPKVKIDQISLSPIGGLYEVMVGTQIFYITGDGKYIIQGSIYDVNQRKDLSEEKLATARVKALGAVGDGNMIIFQPEQTKYTVNVFTDIDCGYCRKLHSEMDKYMAEGITIKYLFFPRAGKGSDAYKKAVTVWCSEDRNAALTEAKKTGKVGDFKSCENPVDEHMALGRKLGASGTPMMITEKGVVLPGYIPAGRLAKILSSN